MHSGNTCASIRNLGGTSKRTPKRPLGNRLLGYIQHVITRFKDYIYIYISAHDRYISILFRWQAVRLLACVREGNLMVARVGSSTQFHVSTPKNACFPLRWLCWSWCASIEGHTTCWRTQGSLWCGA